jgi:capsular exopolysaccharide synthesis family protein
MNRIQQILSKAERDGTARRLEPTDRLTNREPVAPHAPAALLHPVAPAHESQRRLDPPSQPQQPEWTNERIEPVSYAPPPVTAQVSNEVRLDPILVAALQPHSAAAEQYRTLRSRVAQAENGHALRVIQISSPGRHDGKTITALNLALTMAQEFQRRVLVLDGDLRQPRLHALLGLDAGPGLVDVLTGRAALEEALIEIPEYHLMVLRSGGAYERPAEILGSGPMRRLIDTLRTQFDRIVVDSAPAVVSDPGAIAPLADGLLLVVRAGSTTKPAIASAVGALASSKLLGLVFNESGAPLPDNAA